MRKRLYILITLSGIFVAAVFVLHEIMGYQPENPLSVTTFNVGTFDSAMPEMENVAKVLRIRITKEKIELSWQMAVSLLKKELMQETDRTIAVKELLSWIASQSYRHVIVAGDFNTVPFSKTIRAINRHYEDVLWPSLAYFRGTYNESPLPIQPRIDYIFHSPALKCTSAGIVRESAGDHYPVWAVMGL